MEYPATKKVGWLWTTKCCLLSPHLGVKGEVGVEAEGVEDVQGFQLVPPTLLHTLPVKRFLEGRLFEEARRLQDVRQLLRLRVEIEFPQNFLDVVDGVFAVGTVFGQLLSAHPLPRPRAPRRTG